jgi:23S rRNA (adenine2030-N6)-methyltransferase
MNYRHAFHAGNFADVLKHAVLAFCVGRLTRKDKPFWVLDTHAGIGWYDLGGEAARRSPEWRDGVARLWDAAPAAPPAVQAFLGPYLDALRAVNAGGDLKRYPGSPSIVAELARPNDVVRLCELHPEDARALALRFEADPRVTVDARDGYEAVGALLPPKERRGLVIVDPPFEDKDEMTAMARAAKKALERWETGTFVFWRPLKDVWSAERFDAGLAGWLVAERGVSPEKILRADLWARDLAAEGPLAGAGVVVVNPPFGLDDGLLAALPWLAALLAQGAGAGWRLDGAITDETLLDEEGDAE